MSGDDARFVARLDAPAETLELAAHLGAALVAGDLVLLEGDLGAGKTTFVQGLARGMGLAARVKSPTYTLVHEHRGATSPTGARAPGLGHLDLYRMAPGRDLADLGLDDLLERGAVAVEWGGRLHEARPDALLVTLRGAPGDDDVREAELVARRGGRGEALVARAAGWSRAGAA